MTFFLLFSKSFYNSNRTFGRLLIYLCTILSMIATVFFLVYLADLPDHQSNSVFSGDLLYFLLILCPLLGMLASDAIRMVRKDLDAAEIAFQAWLKWKKKGKLRFILKCFGGVLIWELAWMFLMALQVLKVGANMITVIITSLIVIGILLAIAINVWHLNLKYQDDVETLMKQTRGDGIDSILGKYPF